MTNPLRCSSLIWCIQLLAAGAALALAVVFLLAMTPKAQAQTYSVLYSFTGGSDGVEPFAGLVQATNGNLYGTTLMGGSAGYGSIFEITTNGTLTKLHSFANTDGAYPAAGLIQATDGNFYGTTDQGGSHGYGTVFKITSGGTFTSLHSFSNKDGAYPAAELVQATDGNLYGTTTRGGTHNFGTVFKITTGGTLTTLHSFYNSPDAGLIQATDGNLYGTASGGKINYGTVFKITLAGAITILHSFDFTDGYAPEAKLVQGIDGNFYGTTSGGGANNGGTVFTVTSGGTFASLYSFCSQPTCDDGSFPSALIQATDGKLYGVTYREGTKSNGTIFQITTGGSLTTEYSFNGSGTDGDHAVGALMQDTNGDFYGTTAGGGANNDGVVFSLSVGLGPFVETHPSSGKVKTAVKILGTDLTGATSVTFNGKTATFTVKSKSEITTTVPTGATTGKVKVKTPSGTLTSNVNFRVP